MAPRIAPCVLRRLPVPHALRVPGEQEALSVEALWLMWRGAKLRAIPYSVPAAGAQAQARNHSWPTPSMGLVCGPVFSWGLGERFHLL